MITCPRKRLLRDKWTEAIVVTEMDAYPTLQRSLAVLTGLRGGVRTPGGFSVTFSPGKELQEEFYSESEVILDFEVEVYTHRTTSSTTSADLVLVEKKNTTNK